MSKKILYNFWGHLSDKIGISSPDGNASYTPWILQEFMKRGWDVYCGPMDRDMQSVMKYKDLAFEAFSKEKRYKIYKDLIFQPLCEEIEDLDILFLEWRFPTKDNQLDKMHEDFSPDLAIQNMLLEKYANKNVKLVIFDLDYKLTLEDEKKLIQSGYKDILIIETSLVPKRQILPRKTVFIPFDFDEMSQFSTMVPNQNKQLVYVGNNYERDFDFNTKLIPYSNLNPGKVHLVGNWLSDKNTEFREKNPNITYHGRIGFNEFHKKIRDSVAVPLLAKDDYKANGYMTMRILETVLFGSIPIGFSDFHGIRMFLPDSLIVDVENCQKSMNNVIEQLACMGITTREELRQFLIKHLGKLHDAKNFVDVILGEKNGKSK